MSKVVSESQEHAVHRSVIPFLVLAPVLVHVRERQTAKHPDLADVWWRPMELFPAGNIAVCFVGKKHVFDLVIVLDSNRILPERS